MAASGRRSRGESSRKRGRLIPGGLRRLWRRRRVMGQSGSGPPLPRLVRIPSGQTISPSVWPRMMSRSKAGSSRPRAVRSSAPEDRRVYRDLQPEAPTASISPGIARKRVTGRIDLRLGNLVAEATTDADGRFRITGLGRDRLVSLWMDGSPRRPARDPGADPTGCPRGRWRFP